MTLLFRTSTSLVTMTSISFSKIWWKLEFNYSSGITKYPSLWPACLRLRLWHLIIMIKSLELTHLQELCLIKSLHITLLQFALFHLKKKIAIIFLELCIADTFIICKVLIAILKESWVSVNYSKNYFKCMNLKFVII